MQDSIFSTRGRQIHCYEGTTNGDKRRLTRFTNPEARIHKTPQGLSLRGYGPKGSECYENTDKAARTQVFKTSTTLLEEEEGEGIKTA